MKWRTNFWEVKGLIKLNLIKNLFLFGSVIFQEFVDESISNEEVAICLVVSIF